MRNKGFLLVVLLAAAAVGIASAEEVVYFTNGTVLPIRSHQIEGDQIQVDLGDNGFMAFPKSVVEKIEDAPDLVLMPSTATNKMFKSDSSTQVFGASPRQAATSWALPNRMDSDDSNQNTQMVGGVVSVAPMADHSHPALQKLRVNAVQSQLRGGTERVGKDLPGAPRKLANPAVKTKVLTELKSRD